MSNHSFSPEIAKIVGVNAAVLYQNIHFWIEKNKANGKHEYDGQFWTYNSVSAFSDLFDYLTKSQIKTALNKLLDANLIGKSNYNKVGYDKTLWYCVKSPIHLLEIANGSPKNRQPIPDINTDIKTYVKPPNPLKGGWEDVFEKLWKSVLKITPSEIKGRHVKKSSKLKFQKIVSRTENPIPPSRIAHAVMWYYAQEPQTKDDSKFMKGLTPVLNGEAFEVYLDKGAYKTKATAENTSDDVWDYCVRIFKDESTWRGDGPPPNQPNCLAPKEILQKHGYDVLGES